MADLLNTMGAQLVAKTSLTAVGTDIFLSPEFPPTTNGIPVECVFLWESGGYMPGIPEMKPVSSTTKRVWERLFVTVKLRQELEHFKQGRELFDDIIEALDYADLNVTTGAEFKKIRAMSPKPTFKWPSKENFLIWELVFEVTQHRTITANT